MRPCQVRDYVRLASEAAGWATVTGEDYTLPFRRVGPFRQVVVPPFAPYSSLGFGTPSRLEAVLDSLEREFDDLVVHFAPGTVTADLLEARGWSVRTLATFLLDPVIASDLRSWSDGAARNFRRHSAMLEVSMDPGAVESVCDLVVSGFHRSNHRPPLDSVRIPALARSVVDSGLGECWVARTTDGRISAGVILLSSATRTSYWLAGSVPGPAMTVLLGRLFETLATSGYTEFDFVGANTPSIAEFKRRFGGMHCTYLAARRTPNPVLRPLLSVTAGLRRRLRA